MTDWKKKKNCRSKHLNPNVLISQTENNYFIRSDLMKKERKVLIAASEVAPFAKTGGLADTIASMPKALEKVGAEVSVVMPKYSTVDEKKYKLKKVGETFSVPMSGQMVEVSVKTAKMPGTKTTMYFIECEKYFERDEIYGNYGDNDERFALFSRAVVEMLKTVNYKPDVIQCNDWQTALIPAYLKVLHGNDEFYTGVSTVMTVHNIAYQGNFPAETMEKVGLPWNIFTPSGVEYWGQLSYLKAGLVYADLINTVSETYAREIQTSHEYGQGMEGVLAARSNDVYGILNGIDYDVWNPAKDEMIKSTYDDSDLRGKSRCKKTLQKDLDLGSENVPLIGMVTRLEDQKGFDLVAAALDHMMSMDVQVVVIGTGQPHYEEMLRHAAERYHGKLAVNLTHDEEMAHQIYAGSDMLLMPSRFEPCGLGQMVAFKYGTLPVAHNTGGLADTIVDYTRDPDQGSGFLFDEYNVGSMVDALNRAIELYENKRKWNSIVKRIMSLDYSWKQSASKYLELYERAMERTASYV
jgi:starch synthase